MITLKKLRMYADSFHREYKIVKCFKYDINTRMTEGTGFAFSKFKTIFVHFKRKST